MVEVVVFGKPRSFESYEFDFGVHLVQEVENSHHEPIIKPIGYNDVILHYYQKDGIAGWEVYRRCQGYDSDRPGIIFGVGIKSDKDFGLIDTMGNLLMPLWEDFAQAFLDKNYKFKFESIVSALKTTKWSPEEEEKVRNNVSGEDVKAAQQEKQLLLLSIDNPNEIKSVEGSIKEFNDVYIASSPSIFQNLINKDVLAKQANNEIRIVKDGNIVLLQKTNPEKPANEKNGNKSWITWIWGGKGSNSSDPETKGTGGDRKGPNNLHKLVATAAVIALVVAIVCFFVFKSKPADRIELAKAPESGYITDDFDLQPKLFHGKSEKTSTKREEIKWSIEGDGSKYIDFDDAHYLLKINDRFRTDKPREESTIIVIAMHNEKELGKETYKIEKYRGPKANKVIMAPCRALMKVSWSIDPELFYDNNPNVSTDLGEIQFTVSPTGIAHVDNEYKLVVDNRPDNDTQVTVTALLEGKSIGEQIYTIAKKDTFSPPPTIEKGSIICRKLGNNFDPTSISFTSRTIEQYVFIAIDKNGNQLSGGTWSFGNNKIHIPNRNINPVSIGIGEGFNSNQTNSCKVSYKINNNTIAETTITITQ